VVLVGKTGQKENAMTAKELLEEIRRRKANYEIREKEAIGLNRTEEMRSLMASIVELDWVETRLAKVVVPGSDIKPKGEGNMGTGS
jgi:hypothetical protein